MFRSEEKIITAKGEEKDVLTIKIPLVRDEKIYGLSNISIDITVMKQLNSELEKAQKTAEDATKAKSSFLANMSHEIRTPMNAIMGMAHLVSETKLTPKQKEYVLNISTAGEMLLRIINDILDFSKIEAGRLDIEETPFSLTEVLRTLKTLESQKCLEKGLGLYFEIGKGIPIHFIGDPLRLGQILINYTSNAVKFTSEGSITVRLSLQNKSKTHCSLKFEVIDTGIGLTDQQISKLFTSFQQADVSTTRQYGGSGLGLSISKHLAQLMHGSVGVSSVFGKGSNFWCIIELPIDEKNEHSLGYPDVFTDFTYDVSSSEKSAPGVAKPSSVKQYFEGASVLLVEDNDLNIQVAVGMLGKWGIAPDIATNGAIAIQKTKEKRYDLVFMDMQMPVLDGLSACQHIRKQYDSERLPIVAMTANAMKSDIDACIAVGMNNHIAKPIKVSELLKVLQLYLKTYVKLSEPLRKEETHQAAGLFIPGVNLQLALDRLGCDKQTYLGLARQFITENMQTAGNLCTYIRNGQKEDALLLVHSLIGTAATLGAMEVAHVSEDLQQSLKSQDQMKNAGPLLEALTEKLGELLMNLEIAAEQEQKTTLSVKSVQLKEFTGESPLLLQDLLGMLKKHNPKRSLDLYEQCLLIRWPEDISVQLLEAGHLIKAFHFKEAADLICTITNKDEGAER